MYVFFSGIVLWRNHYIRSEALVEESPILLLLRRLEACEWLFLKLLDKHQKMLRELLKIIGTKK